MNAEDTMLAKEMKGKRKRDEGTINNCDKKKELLDKRLKFTNFTPLIMPIEQVLM